MPHAPPYLLLTSWMPMVLMIMLFDPTQKVSQYSLILLFDYTKYIKKVCRKAFFLVLTGKVGKVE